MNFIQIGANIGNHPNDPLWPIIRDRGWRGIFIEPLPHIMAQLKKNYADVEGCAFEQVAIVETEVSEVVIRYRKEDDSQQASIIPGYFAFNDTDLKVPATTLHAIVKKYDMWDKPFDLLQIDAEGMDGVIIFYTDFEHVLPEYVRFENFQIGRCLKAPSQADVHQHLVKAGYKEVTDTLEHRTKCPKIDKMYRRTV